jgi:hypothetical protein
MKAVTQTKNNDFFHRMLDARDPSVSSSRFLTLVTVFLILYVWLLASIYTGTIADIPMGVIYFAGLVVTGKTVQSFSENKGNKGK